MHIRYSLPAHASKSANDRYAAGEMTYEELMSTVYSRATTIAMSDDRVAPLGTHLSKTGPPAGSGSTLPASISYDGQQLMISRGTGMARKGLPPGLPLTSYPDMRGYIVADVSGAGMRVHKSAPTGHHGGPASSSASIAAAIGGSLVLPYSEKATGPLKLTINAGSFHGLSRSEPAAASFHYTNPGQNVAAPRPREVPVSDLVAAYSSATGDISVTSLGAPAGTKAPRFRFRARLYPFPDVSPSSSGGGKAGKRGKNGSSKEGWVLLPVGSSILTVLHSLAVQALADTEHLVQQQQHQQAVSSSNSSSAAGSPSPKAHLQVVRDAAHSLLTDPLCQDVTAASASAALTSASAASSSGLPSHILSLRGIHVQLQPVLVFSDAPDGSLPDQQQEEEAATAAASASSAAAPSSSATSAGHPLNAGLEGQAYSCLTSEPSSPSVSAWRDGDAVLMGASRAQVHTADVTSLPSELIDALTCLQLMRDELAPRAASAQPAALGVFQQTASSSYTSSSTAAGRQTAYEAALTKVQRELASSSWHNSALAFAVEQQLADATSAMGGHWPLWMKELLRSHPTLASTALPHGIRRTAAVALSGGSTRAMASVEEQDKTLSNIRQVVLRRASAYLYGAGGREEGPAPVTSGDLGEIDLDHSVTAMRLALLRGAAASHGVPHRDRVAIDKANMLRSAELLTMTHSRLPCLRADLEISFAGDKGSGSGVNREFYAGLAAAFQEIPGSGPPPAPEDSPAAAAAASRSFTFPSLSSSSAAAVQDYETSMRDLPVVLWHNVAAAATPATSEAQQQEQDEAMDTAPVRASSSNSSDASSPARGSKGGSSGGAQRSSSRAAAGRKAATGKDEGSDSSDDVVMITPAATPIRAPSASGAAATGRAYVQHPEGLFPCPLTSEVTSHPSHMDAVKRRFALLGRLLGQALQDGRMLPLPLSPLLLAQVQRLLTTGSALPLTSSSSTTCLSPVQQREAAVLHDVTLQRILTSYYPNLAGLLTVALARAEMRRTGTAQLPPGQQLRTPAGHAVEDMWLSFEEPATSADLSAVQLGGSVSDDDVSEGYTADSSVTSDNVDAWMARLMAFVGATGIAPQLTSLAGGLTDVIADPLALNALTPMELRDLVCGSPRIEWDTAELNRFVVASHGYTVADKAVQMLFKVLMDMTQAERAAFLRFATGQPALPVGGLAALNPPLTIIRKIDGVTAPRRSLPGFVHRALKGPQTASSFSSSSSAAAASAGGGGGGEVVEIIDLEDGSPAGAGAGAGGSSSSSSSSSSGGGAGVSSANVGVYDHLWISASTCFHQVKMPPYSDASIMKAALTDAIAMSAGLIDLS